MIKLSRFGTGQRGDTIVEVLVALIIASVVLVGAFSISNLSQKQIRMAQERNEAQKIAEGAVETLDVMYATDPAVSARDGSSTSDPAKSPFCRVAASFAAESTKQFVDNPTNCKSGPSDLYHTAIVATTSDTFTVKVSWPSLSGRNESLELYYRVRDTK